ncbi:RNA-directed DNA polymerase, eukaryota [Tanacetum coccineum]
MSKLDRFLISEGLLLKFPSLSAICLDRHLSDHRPIIMREVVTDYGPSPFRVYQSWFHKKGFDKLIKDSWSYSSSNDSNKIILLKKKLHQALKASIKEWCGRLESVMFTFDEIKESFGIAKTNKSPVSFPPDVIHSFIALIPKKHDAKFVKDYRPISLIGCFYKIVSKILANRLKMVISELISDVQSAFESLHLSFNNIINADLFKGYPIDDSLDRKSHLFYADEQSSLWQMGIEQHILTIIRMLKMLLFVAREAKPFGIVLIAVLLYGNRSLLLAQTEKVRFPIYSLGNCILKELNSLSARETPGRGGRRASSPSVELVGIYILYLLSNDRWQRLS